MAYNHDLERQLKRIEEEVGFSADVASETATLSAVNNDQTHNFSSPRRWIVIENLNQLVDVRVTVGGALYRVRPGGCGTIRANGASSINYSAEYGRARLRVTASNTRVYEPSSIGVADPVEVAPTIGMSVFSVNRDYVLAVSPGAPRTTQFSTDMGRTFTAGHEWGADVPIGGHVTQAGTILIEARIDNDPDDCKVYRSTDGGETFTEVAITKGGSPVTTRGWYGQRGINEMRAAVSPTTDIVIMFADYSSTSGGPNRIYRSRDDGETFQVVFDDADEEVGIGHFHNVDYDFSRRRWWATSGDTPGATHWLYSDDDGDTWHEAVLPFPTSDNRRRRFRVVGMAFDSDGAAYFANDDSATQQGVWKAFITDGEPDSVSEGELIMNHQGTAYGLRMFGDTIYVASMQHPQNVHHDMGGLFVSRDRGRTWRRLISAGYQRLHGPDSDGGVWVNGGGGGGTGGVRGVFGARIKVP